MTERNMTNLPPELRLLLLQRIFDNPPNVICQDCGGYHLRACPRVKRKCFHANGNLIEVEYWSDRDYDDSETVYPEDAYDDVEELADDRPE